MGMDSRFGLRFSECRVLDLCHVRTVRNCTFYTFLLQNQSDYIGYSAYSSKEYREATTKEEQCKVPIEDWEIGKVGNMEKMKKEYHEYCLKSTSNNIIFCPEEIIKRKRDKKVQWINDHFKKTWLRDRISVSIFVQYASLFVYKQIIYII